MCVSWSNGSHDSATGGLTVVPSRYNYTGGRDDPRQAGSWHRVIGIMETGRKDGHLGRAGIKSNGAGHPHYTCGQPTRQACRPCTAAVK